MRSQKRSLAVKLRKRGYSLREISQRLKISKSSASLWVRGVILPREAKQRLQKLRLAAMQKSGLVLRSKRLKREFEAGQYAIRVLSKFHLNSDTSRVFCALIYWCEGTKSSRGSLSFTNSDPLLVKTFLGLLRSYFEIDESKFRVCVHLHSYHDPTTQLRFWSKITRIPLRQFIKPYRKFSSGRYQHLNYQGCIAVRYHDVALTRKLLKIASGFMKKYGRVR